MRQDLADSPVKKMGVQDGLERYALGVATVTRVDYEAFTVTLRTETGEQSQPTAIPLTVPGAGHRHFFGAMPEVGDVAVIGWGPQESGHTRAPYILGWLVPGSTLGHEWVSTQPYDPEDWAQTTGRRERFKGIADRIRHKLRHMEPGTILASSSRGADLVLNESALLANRRGGELHLRDQDNSIVMRSSNQFHAMGGARIYAGMVQRDADLLPTQMFSDGTDWDSARQIDGTGRALSEFELDDDPLLPQALTPSQLFQKSTSGTRESGIFTPGNIDPYSFLQRGLFIDASGRLTRNTTSEAVYGGKPIFRLAADANNKVNSVTRSNVDTFSEYRIEVSHVTDGTLPVTEQTDGFDADRLPDAVPTETSPLGGSDNSPYVEMVMGTVVGNDAFSQEGKSTYGLPLRPQVFDGPVRAPAMVSGLGAPVEDHAAFMLRVNPPFTPSDRPSFLAITKDGRLKGSFAGPGGESPSAELSFGSNTKIGVDASTEGESISFDTEGRINLRNTRGDNRENIGVEVSSSSGAIRIYGGGATTVGGVARRTVPTDGGESDAPSVSIEAATNLHLTASKSIKLSANTLDLKDISGFAVTANSSVAISSGDKVATNGKVIETTATGKMVETFSGPKDSLPTNLPLRSTTFSGTPATGVPGGPVDVYKNIYGDRLETFTAGNHTTSVQVGNQTYQVSAGSLNLLSGATAINLTTGSASVTTPGAITMTAAGGAVAVTASTAFSVTSATYLNTAAAVSFPNPALQPSGAVLTDGCINSLTGTPFRVSGTLGVQAFRIGPA